MTRQTAIMILILAGFVTQGFAQPSERTRDLVSQLGADTWIERDLATLELINIIDESGLPDLELFFSDTTLSLEQRTRLKLVCISRFIEYPKGGLGVSFGDVSVGSVEVIPIENNPMFPASAMLNPGDAIALVDGELMNSALTLRLEILSREPGEILPVTIIRNHQLIEMELPLGSSKDLNGGTRINAIEALLALEIRWKRVGVMTEPPKVIGAAITKEQWIRAAFPANDAPDARATTRRLLTAAIGGAHQLVYAGVSSPPRRFMPWAFAEDINQRAIEIMITLNSHRKQVNDARRRLIGLEINGLNDELDSTDDALEMQRLQDEIEILDQRIIAIDAQNELIFEAQP